jgi:beta-glucosidase
MMRPPQRAVPVELDAGEELAVVLGFAPGTAGGFGGADLRMVTFQLNAARATADEQELGRAEALAAGADVAVVVVGTTEEVESEGFDRDSLALPGRQGELVRRVAAANPRTVVVVNAGAPVLLPWADEVPAVLLAWFPGQEFGNALADVLLGVVEPGGRLPTTWPASADGLPSTRPVGGVLAYDEGLLVGYRAGDRGGSAPLYPFGHGLGYTTWEYLDVEAPARLGPTAGAVVRVRVRNSGTRPGREVVQVYAARPGSAVERPPRWLAGFATVDAAPGEEAVVAVTVPGRSLAHWDTGSHAWTVEPGTFVLTVGRSSRDLRLEAEVAT